MTDSLGYKDSLRFLREYNHITYPEFDYYSVHNLNLFASFEDINLEEIDHQITLIEQILPSMKRIFAKPIIHLVDEEEIVPVEAVKKVTNKTINYTSNHAELWEDVNRNGIQPRKLLTENHKDNYAIYENVVFARAVDHALTFLRRYSRLLKDMIYTNKKLEIDLLERENHMSYYLALGKLETGHIRSFAKYADIAYSLIDRMDFLLKVITSRLHRPVYEKCHKVKGKLRLRKTNILSMQKDYRNIYRYMKSVYKEDDLEESNSEDEEGYLYFCKYLIVFAIGHFNFAMDKEKKIDFEKLNIDFSFKDYLLNVSDVIVDERRMIQLTFLKDKEYQILLYPNRMKEEKIESDLELHILNDDFEGKDTLVSIDNIDSFRRIQQLLLKGMIYSTEKFDICPFCGNEMIKNEEGYTCPHCRQVIRLHHCPETNRPYYVTTISHFRLNDTDEGKSSLLMNRTNESLLHYRNITKITSDLKFVCPHCNKVHSIVEENESKNEIQSVTTKIG
jgi:predicted RNA-binding Zn-ribbon protein involved in translation (DUF1610 family)